MASTARALASTPDLARDCFRAAPAPCLIEYPASSGPARTLLSPLSLVQAASVSGPAESAHLECPAQVAARHQSFSTLLPVSAASDKSWSILHRRPAFSGSGLAPPGRISPPPHPFASVSIAPQVDRTCQPDQAPARYPAETRPQPVHPSHFAYKQLLDSYVRMGDWGLAPRPAPALKSLLELHPDSGRPCLSLSEIQPSRRQPRSCASAFFHRPLPLPIHRRHS